MATEKRLIDGNALIDKLKRHRDFYINAWGSFSNMNEKDKARVDEITQCIAEVINTPTVDADHLIANGVTLLPETGIGDMSDGYHTFNELYHHRAVLFSVICNLHPLCSWKAKKHHDGTMYDGMFIVGINTPEGQATYHYDIDPYWDMFKVPEAEFAPEWDGHTADEAIRRIALLGSDGKDSDVPAKWISVKDRLPEDVYGKDREKIVVLVRTKSGKVSQCARMADYECITDETLTKVEWIENGKFYWSKGKKVTHWMPLPQPPKGE